MILYKLLKDYTAAMEDMIVRLEKMKYGPTTSDDEFDNLNAAADSIETAHNILRSMIERHKQQVLSNIS